MRVRVLQPTVYSLWTSCMLAGPIFRVEMVSAARRDRYFWLRVIYGAIILFVLWTTYANMNFNRGMGGSANEISIRERAQAAAYFYLTYSWVQLLGLLAVAPVMAVGTIATERERRTIEYLFATDLSNTEIVLGKTVARLLLVGKFAAVSLPILFLFRLLGGIPARLVAASFLIAGSTALVLTAVSVCVSVWSKRSRDASIRVYLVLAAILFLPPLLGTIFPFVRGSSIQWAAFDRAIGFLNELNPMMVLGQSMGAASGLGAGFNFAPVLKMAAWHAGIAVALVALATMAVRRVHLRDAGRGPRRSRLNLRLPTLPRWRPGLGDHPVLWKEAFAATSKTRLGIIGYLAAAALGFVALASVVYAFAIAVDVRSSGGFSTPARRYCEFTAPFGAFVGAGVLMLVAARASGLVTVEKERDCWTSLLSTPLTGADVIRGKTLGNLYAARWGLALLAVAWALGLVFDARFILVAAITTAVLLLCAWFLTAVGLYYSLKSNTSLRALGFTLFTGGFIGGGYMFCCCPVLAVSGGSDDHILVGLAANMPFLLCSPAGALSETDWGPNSQFQKLAVAFGVGVVGYLIASVVLTHYLVQEFDALAGRAKGVPDNAPYTLP